MFGDAEAVHDRRALRFAVHARRRDQIAGVDAADFSDALGRIGLNHRLQVLKAFRARADEFLINEAVMNKLTDDAVREGDVCARTELEMNLRALCEPDVAGINHDELQAPADRRTKLHADHRMRFLGVRAHKHHDLGVFADVRNRIRHGARAERSLKARHGGTVADARAVVDVVGLEDRARHLLEHVDVFVRGPRAGEGCERFASELVAEFRELLRDEIKRLVPGSGFKLARDGGTDEGRRQTAVGLHEVEARRAALHAEESVVRGAVRRFRIDDAAVLHDQVVLAARRAVRTRRADLLDFPRAVGAAALHRDGARRAGRGAGAAGFAVRALPVPAEGREDRRAKARLAGDQRVVPGSVVARAHAALAADAERRIEGDEGVAVEDLARCRRNFEGRRFDAEFAAAVLKLAASVLRAAEAVLRAVQAVLGDDELKRRAAGPVDRFRTGLHDHAGVRERIAGGDEPAHAFDLHHAEAAGADIAHVLQVAEGRDVNAGGTRRIKKRCALFDRDRAAVHRNVKHTESSRPRLHPRRSSRSAGSGCIPERLLPCSSRARRP